MKIKFHQIQRESVFCSDFVPFNKNNEIEFSKCGIIVIYAPNGTGKTSLSKALKADSNTQCALSINGALLTDPLQSTFHIIEDQNGRNFIKGDTEDFMLGDNIRREYVLKTKIDEDFNKIYGEIAKRLKDVYKISTIKNLLITKIENTELQNFVEDIVNTKSKGKKIDRDRFINNVINRKKIELPELDETKFSYVIDDYSGTTHLLERTLKLSQAGLTTDANVRKIEEHDEAIKILERFDYLDECVVCDTKIDRKILLERKKEHKVSIIASLDERTKEILESFISNVDPSNDPFAIKSNLLNAISSGKLSYITNLQESIQKFFLDISHGISNSFIENLSATELINNYREYQKLVQEKLVFSDEDILFIERFIGDCIGKNIELDRDSEKNIKLLLDKKELLNTERTKLSLSNGEQNFISLAFELLRAKNVPAGIVVLDDPISSFDSIYKNKITYAIIKFLENKKQIILTHSTEMIKLLEHQKNNCFNLYILNNTENEENGFININENERGILLYIYQLIDLFRGKIQKQVVDEKCFLISTIPFMRGLCQILNDKESKDKLTHLMHGYSTEKINLTTIYNKVFSTDWVKTTYEITINDIMSVNTDNLCLISKKQYPLLNKTLRHTITYLQLRLSVEKKLVDKFSINTNKYQMLQDIINAAFKYNDPNVLSERVFLLSRKTLLNEFNHFEVDMSIFQPAIDITDTELLKEKKDIIKFLANL